MTFVISNFRGYLHVDNDEHEHWLRSPYSADKFELRQNAERVAKECSEINAVVVEL